METVCFVLVAILVILLLIQPSIHEGFGLNTMPYGDIAKPLLDDYKERKPPHLTDNEYYQIYGNYPVYSANSNKNNNIRYWSRPTNGKCSPAEFCGSLYDSTQQNIPEPPKPQPWTGVTRVNYYASCD